MQETGAAFPPITGTGPVPEAANPFKLPSDDKIFRMREEEKKRKDAEREASKSLRVWEKTKSANMSRSGRLQELVGETRTLKLSDVGKGETADSSLKLTAPPRRQEKENMTEFIAKKREMFLVQMSLDTKREEIRKLEEKAQMKEEALQRSEQMLEEDAMRFDAFLKENDKKAHDAIKRADEETKRKQEKTSEIKRLTQQIQALSSEMSKHRESLEDCMRYKDFLDKLTPPEWFESHHKAFLDSVAAAKKDQHSVKMKEWEKMKRRLQEQHVKEQQAKKDKQRERARRAGGLPVEEEEDEVESKLVIPPPPRLEDETCDYVEEEPPMYFTEPKQLMDIFSSLEEQNLFLIQNSQETEHTLEELRHAFKDTKSTMDARTGLLQKQIDELQGLIATEESKAKALIQKRDSAAELGAAVEKEISSQQEKESMLHELHLKVREVYTQCGHDAASKPNTLFMLSTLENQLERLLAEIEKMPLDIVIAAEKAKEKKRRADKREEQLKAQIKAQEERNRRAIERSMQAPKKRTGRQVMQRSRPVRKEKTQNVDAVDDGEDLDELRYLSEN